MPITKIEFLVARDVHLVAGQSTVEDLDSKISVTPVAGNSEMLSSYLSGHTDVAVDFKPTFKIQTTTAQEYKGFGIAVNRKNGRVTINSGTLPSPRPHNFIVEAIVTKNTGGVAPATIPPAFTRFHVHQQVAHVSLTPKPLTIRAKPGSTAKEVFQQWTVRAQFDDGTVADVTDSDQLKFSPTTIMTDGENHISIPGSASPGDLLDVKVTTSALWGNKEDSAKIQLLKEWSNETNAPQAEFVDGLVDINDRTIRPEDAINILIVACGFPAAAIPAPPLPPPQDPHEPFRSISLAIVDRLSRQRLYQPFGYLSRSINFWRLPMIAKDPGINVRPEVRLFFQSNVLVAGPMRLPRTPQPSLSDWAIEDLIYAVGVPVPGDQSLIAVQPNKPPVTDLDSIRMRDPQDFKYDALFTRWKNMARAIPGISFDQVSPELAHEWIGLADRTFVDDVDTFPAVAMGDPPSVDSSADQTSLQYDTRRNGDDVLEQLLRRLTPVPNPVDGSIVQLDGIAPDNALGQIWVVDPFDPATPRTWKFNNRRMVVGLCNSPVGRASARILTRLARYSTTATDSVVLEGFPVTRVPGRSTLQRAVDVPHSGALDEPTYNSFAHEVAHNFMLGDEYSERAATSPDVESDLSHSGNLTTDAAVKDANGIIAVDQIKWNWHRIRKSCAFTHPLVFRGNGLFNCSVRKVPSQRFAPRDKVLLRRRGVDRAIDRAIVIVGPIEFEVKEVHTTNLNTPNDVTSVTIVIQADDPFIDGAMIVENFGMGVMYVPVPAPQTVQPARQYLTLVPPAAERILQSTGLSMTGNACNANASGSGIHAPVADPLGKVPPNISPHVVGAYFGGGLYACGVLRPTALCMMRNHRLDPEQQNKDKSLNAPQGVSKFCVVCSYVMIEYADPDQHWLLDRDYATWYPF